jgi:hypothetical protein
MLQQDRVELKFVVADEQAAFLKEALKPRMAADANELGFAHYCVTTLNFDTPDLQNFWDRERGVPSRRKIRLRIYSDAGPGRAVPGEPAAFLEVKHKLNGRCLKTRLDLPFSLARELAGTGNPDLLDQHFPGDPQAAAMAREMRHRGLIPVCLVHYERHALQGGGAESDLRVTFDSHLQYRVENFRPEIPEPFHGVPLRDDGGQVLEVKTLGVVPLWLARLLTEAGCVSQSMSKYCGALTREGLEHRQQISHSPKP